MPGCRYCAERHADMCDSKSAVRPPSRLAQRIKSSGSGTSLVECKDQSNNCEIDRYETEAATNKTKGGVAVFVSGKLADLRRPHQYRLQPTCSNAELRNGQEAHHSVFTYKEPIRSLSREKIVGQILPERVR